MIDTGSEGRLVSKYDWKEYVKPFKDTLRETLAPTGGLLLESCDATNGSAQRQSFHKSR